MTQYPGRLYHDTPPWVKSGTAFHIRIRATPPQPPLVEGNLGHELLRAAERFHRLGHWWCQMFLLMPDHLHAILSFPRTPGMTITIRNWKRSTKRFQNVAWQEGFFDHRLRNSHEAEDKWHYIRRNPVARGLCATEDDWPWWWSAVVENPMIEKLNEAAWGQAAPPEPNETTTPP